MGQRAADTTGITFEDVVVPKEVSIVCPRTSFIGFSLDDQPAEWYTAE